MNSRRLRRLEWLRSSVRRVEEARAGGLIVERDRLSGLAREAQERSDQALPARGTGAAAVVLGQYEFAAAERERAGRLEEAGRSVEAALEQQRQRVIEAPREEQRLGRLGERLRDAERCDAERAAEQRLEEFVLRTAVGGGGREN